MLPNEKEILKRTVEGLLKLDGVTGINVDDGGDEYAVKGSKDFDEIYKACNAVDDCRLYVKNSFVYFIWNNGNDGLDCICDYGISLEPVMAPIFEWIESK